MVVEPERPLSAYAEAGADHVLIQAEPGSTVHLHRMLSQISELEAKHFALARPPRFASCRFRA